MFGEKEVERWLDLLRQAAKEKDPLKRGAIFLQIEMAARNEQEELQRKITSNVWTFQAYPWSASSHQKRRPSNRFLNDPNKSHPSQADVVTKEDSLGDLSKAFSRYLRLADAALNRGKNKGAA